ncbi:MAG: hypothetical protein CBD58_00745 [bacterium TMED198]|nr:MAG: hypothetical protein CBD58_00745 [bacterium TMED198]|tara:strand:- start:73 stop:501 length:429 start_codon:yes stop_codon:yes gene_type:complete
MDNQKVLDKFKRILKSENLKVTPQRLSILKEAVMPKGHRDIEQIMHDLIDSGIKVSRATLYRTLDILHTNGFIRKMNIGDGADRYETKIDSPHHDHMICIETGKIIEFTSDKIESIQEKIAKDNGYKIVKHIHQLFVKPINK